MGTTADVLAEVRTQIDAHAAPLHEARLRLALVKECAAGYPGSLRTYSSGSLAMHTMNHPVNDGDGRLSRATVSRRIAAGEIATIKVGNRHRIPVAEYQRFRRDLMRKVTAYYADDIEDDLT
ncbi:MAG: helix-turn-helix domain-containing protein [Micrococcales bacterium]|nr:helix-turn-helix domain-containing protein [Micrococcales bacterium]MCL2668035.1 helix-turn-helix domain-containing protein [Micrococcales bacterium]